MAKDARQPIGGWRNEALTLPIRVMGLDLTGKVLRAQVRLAPGAPGAPLIDLATVANGNAEGVRLVEVTIANGVPTSRLSLRVNKTTMQGLPAAGELGTPTALAYALQLDGVTRLQGPFLVLDSAIDSDANAANRAAGGSAATVGGASGGLSLTIGNDGVTVAIDGAGELARLLEQAAGIVAAAAAERAGAGAERAGAAAERAAATGQRTAAELAAAQAGASAGAANLSSLGAATARTGAETAAAAAGQYREGIEQAVAGLPVNAVLPLQAATRTILASFTGQAAGRQAFLSEAGRAGAFEWLTGNQSARVTSDPDQALYVAPASQPDGSAGVWRRIHDGIAQSSWTRAQPSTAASGATYPDNYIRLIRQPDVEEMRLRAGIHNLKFTLEVPADKNLRGTSINGTTLRSTDDFVNGNAVSDEAYPLGRGHRNALICLTEGGRQHVSDVTIDGRKAPIHVNGINAIETAAGATAERLHIKNIRNYAVWSVGNFIQNEDTASMSWRDILVENSHIAFEAQSGSNVLFERCHYRDGDADVDCGSMFHPYAGCRHVTYRDCTGIGGAQNIITIVGDVSRDCTDITFDNVFARNTRPDAIGIVAVCYSFNIKRTRVVNCDLEVDGIGLYMELSAGLVADFHFIGGRISARGEVFQVRGKSKLWLDDLYIKARPSDASAFCIPVAHDEADIRINGGTWDLSAANLDANGTPAIAWPHNVTVVSQPQLIGNIGLIPPWGVGHETRLTMPQDSMHPAFTGRIVGRTDQPGDDFRRWQGSLRPGTYEVQLRGTYRQTTTNGLVIAFQAYGAPHKITGAAELAASATEMVRKPVSTDSAGEFTSTGIQTNATDQAGVARAFNFNFILEVSGEGLGVQVVADGFADGTAIIEKGSIIRLKRIA